MTAVAVVEQFLDAFARHDLEDMVDVLAPDAYFVPSGHDFAPAYGDFSGHEGWRDWWATTHGERLRLDCLEIKQLDAERVLAELLIGAPADNGWMSVVRVCVYRVRDGKLAAIEVFSNRDLAYDRAQTSSTALPRM